jgi:hypothetical protein
MRFFTASPRRKGLKMSHLPLHLPDPIRPGANFPENLRNHSRALIKPYLVSAMPKKSGAQLSKPFVKLACEDEDAKITGSTRSLARRLLGLNVRGSLRSIGVASVTITTADIGTA